MGKYKKGILGRFRGLVGTVIGSVWKGIAYMKSLPDFGPYNPSEAQVNANAKFALIGKFLKRIKALINVGYQQFNKGVTPMNAATGYHLKNAITGTSSLNYAIDFSKVQLSVGDLLDAESAEILVNTPAKLNFSWINKAPVTDTGGTDKATLCVYNPLKDKFVVLAGAAARSAEAYILSLPADFSADEVQVWIYFVSAEGKEVSNSFYVGEFLVL